MKNKLTFLLPGTIMMLLLGLIYGYSLFAAPLEKAFGWNRLQTSLTFTISMIGFCLGTFLGGFLLRRLSIAAVLRGSALLFAIGFALASRLSTLTEFFIYYGVFCGLGVGLAYNAILSIVPKKFPDHRGTASGFLMMALGLGTATLASLVRYLFGLLGWQKSFVILAVLFSTVFFLGSFFFTKRALSTEDEKATAGAASVSASSSSSSSASSPASASAGSAAPAAAKNDFKTVEMLGQANFIKLSLWNFLLVSLGLGVIGHTSGLATSSASGLEAALAIALISFSNAFGRILFGFVADRMGVRKAMILGAGCGVLGTLAVYFGLGSTEAYLLAAGLILIGLSYGGSPAISSTGISRFFGLSHYPLNFSMIILGMIPSALLGPTISGQVFVRTQGYSQAILLFLGLSLLALLFGILMSGQNRLQEKRGGFKP